MPDTPLESGHSDDAATVLAEARRLMRRGDGWEADDYDSLRADCEAIGIRGEPSITIALRKAFGEISADDMHQRTDLGYGDLCAGRVLHEARWQSDHCRCRMYVKFSVFEGRLVIVKFHEDRLRPMNTKRKRSHEVL